MQNPAFPVNLRFLVYGAMSSALLSVVEVLRQELQANVDSDRMKAKEAVIFVFHENIMIDQGERKQGTGQWILEFILQEKKKENQNNVNIGKTMSVFSLIDSHTRITELFE